MAIFPVFVSLALLPLPASASSFDEQHGCGEAASPAEISQRYCNQYDSDPRFEGVPPISAAKAACLDFYRTGVEAQNLLCSRPAGCDPVVREEESREKEACAEDAPAVNTAHGPGQANSLAAAQLTIAQAEKTEFRKALRAKLERLRESAAAYEGKIGRMMGEAYTNLAQEQECWERPAVAVPSVLQAGLARMSHEEFQGNFRRLSRAMRAAGSTLSPSEKEEQPDQLIVEKPDRKPKPIEAPEKTPSNRTTDASRLFAQFFSAQGASSALKEFNPALGKATPYLGKGAGAAVGLLVEYYNRGTIDSISLAKVGAFAVGGGWFMSANLAIASYLDSKEKRRAYLEFAQKYVSENPKASAEELSRAHAKSLKRSCKY